MSNCFVASNKLRKNKKQTHASIENFLSDRRALFPGTCLIFFHLACSFSALLANAPCRHRPLPSRGLKSSSVRKKEIEKHDLVRVAAVRVGQINKKVYLDVTIKLGAERKVGRFVVHWQTEATENGKKKLKNCPLGK
jgi:hypothetical protein